MYQLRHRDYWRVSHLFDGQRYNLVVESVLAGHTPAWIAVDDAGAPRTAWMWNRMGTMLLSGNPGNDTFNRALSALLRERVAPDARRRQIPSFTVRYSPDGWEDKLDRLLPGSRAERIWRRSYRFGRLTVDWREELPSDGVLQRIDSQVLEADRPRNVDSVLGWIQSFWHTEEDFAETGFGTCLLLEEVIVNWCLTVYASVRDVELGMATVPDCRNRGYATLVAAACLEVSTTRGYRPHWHCDEANQPSMRVAERVGFSNPTRYPVYALAL